MKEKEILAIPNIHSSELFLKFLITNNICNPFLYFISSIKKSGYLCSGKKKKQSL